ncbi:Crp/Fnr family transcriptional regulator [Spiribacter halobius]|uniref:Crp/Fnr family transcriptional regulator n=1 Tax=Sediminicurvatus halobius TaxID=2182432 RepID=A0A2U2MXE7_9GAMM|nr:Crp/Fnr family transcriptional regulator [Spiribacter halobius]PWG61476.1 hypothetical protein DEM34_16065 [Spiribacter halobius]UEX77986.1 Crp/Fnr family transcriptional regulator [Spiribacter halobius]
MREYNFGAEQERSYPDPDEYIARLAQEGVQVSKCRGESIYHQGDPADSVWLLLEGAVKAATVSRDGEETLLRVHVPGGIIGLTALDSDGIRDASTCALTDAVLVCLDREQVLSLMMRDPLLAICISRVLIHRLCSFHSRINEVLGNTVEQRVARVLLALYQPETSAASPLPEGIKLSHEELAQIVASRRQTVTMILNRFAAAGYIETVRRRILVREPESLRRFVPCNP